MCERVGRQLRLLLVIVMVLMAAPGAASAAPGLTTPPAGDAVGDNWAVYGGNLFNQRYSSLDQINAGNVGNLKGAWTFHTGASTNGTSFETSPLVVDGTMYLTGPQSQVYALDATNGQQKWSYVPDLGDIAALPLCCGQVNR